MNNEVKNEFSEYFYLENDYIDKIIEKNLMVDVFLSNGVRLEGKILGYGSDTIKLTANRKVGNTTIGSQIIYKKFITTLMTRENG